MLVYFKNGKIFYTYVSRPLSPTPMLFTVRKATDVGDGGSDEPSHGGRWAKSERSTFDQTPSLKQPNHQFASGSVFMSSPTHTRDPAIALRPYGLGSLTQKLLSWDTFFFSP